VYSQDMRPTTERKRCFLVIRSEYKLFTNEELVEARKDAVKTFNAGDSYDSYETTSTLKRKRKKFKAAKKLLRKLGREFRIRNLPLEGEPETFTGKPETPFVMMEWAVERHGEWTQHANLGDCIVYIRKRKAWWQLDYYSGKIDYLLSRVRIHKWNTLTTSWEIHADYAKNKPEHRVNL
jgi:hypothetical protein